MAESTTRSIIKQFLKDYELPSSRQAFLKEFDGNADAITDLQNAIANGQDDNAIAILREVTDGATSDDDVVAAMADYLYPQKTGQRGKQPVVEERVEGNLPPGNKEDTGTLDKTPYESLSNTDRAKLTSMGFPAKDVKDWDAKSLAATLEGGTKKPAAKKATAKKPEAKPPAEQKPAQAAVPASSVTDVIEQRRPTFSVTTQPDDLLSAAQAGQTTTGELDRVLNSPPVQGRPLTREDAMRYMQGGQMVEPVPFSDQMAAMLGGPGRQPVPQPPAAASPPPAPGGLTSADMEALLGAGPTAPQQSLDLSGLLGRDGVDAPDAPESMAYPPPSPDAPTLIPSPTPQANPWNRMGTSDTPPPPPSSSGGSSGEREFLPFRSQANKFWQARLAGQDEGLGKALTGAAANAAVLGATGLDLMMKPYIGIPAAIGMYRMATGGGQQQVTQDEMAELERRRDEARAAAESAFGGFTEPARRYSPQPAANEEMQPQMPAQEMPQKKTTPRSSRTL